MKNIGFLLIDGFALLSYASVIEPFRAANIMAGEQLYRWVHISLDGEPVRASTGAIIAADKKADAALDLDMLFVIVGGDPSGLEDRPLFGWLRLLARAGTPIAGVAGGPFLLAKAGLLDGYRCTIHWELIPSLQEQFPRLLLEQSLYVVDRKRLTCAGGSAGLDLAIDVIERDHGHALAVKVSDWFVRTNPRRPTEQQKVSLSERYHVTDDRILKALALMEANVEAPLDIAKLAEATAISQRQLERLFGEQLGATAYGIYRRIRLNQANILIRKTSTPLTSIALACGFNSSSSFSRSFRNEFRETPRAIRAVSRSRAKRD
nr:GlxA family transcriptional regulator [Sphingomonas sp. Y57]